MQPRKEESLFIVRRKRNLTYKRAVKNEEKGATGPMGPSRPLSELDGLGARCFDGSKCDVGC